MVCEDCPGKTLAELYAPDKMPDDLREAHYRLDLIVESCYQEKPFANDEERLECLFNLCGGEEGVNESRKVERFKEFLTTSKATTLVCIHARFAMPFK